MPASRYTAEPQEEYDFIVVGGGTAGCLIAAGLSRGNASARVLLLEAGSGIRDGLLSEQTVPGAAANNVAWGNIDWGYTIEPQQTPLLGTSPVAYDRRSYPIPRGFGLGGSNELNYMLHVRGTPGDYKVWQRASGGDERWGPSSMLAAEKEYEDRVVYGSKLSPSDETHSHVHPVAVDWVAAANQSVLGSQTGSYNNPAYRRDGGMHFEHATRRGRRESTARDILLPELVGAEEAGARAAAGGALHVVVNALVGRVLLSHNSTRTTGAGRQHQHQHLRATGVEVSLSACYHNSISVPILGTVFPSLPCLLDLAGDWLRWLGYETMAAPLGASVGPRVVWATSNVILSAGAYESPHLLMKSGIGDAAALRAVGITPRVGLPGVGKHLQDHPIVGLKYRLGPLGGTWFPSTLTKLWALFPSTVFGYLVQGKGALSSSVCDLGYEWQGENKQGRGNGGGSCVGVCGDRLSTSQYDEDLTLRRCPNAIFPPPRHAPLLFSHALLTH